jgi:anti-sigma regulatory factor (Ser/Thr protein kinase)
MRVDAAAEIRRAEDCARRLASQLGFSADACEEITLVVAELGSNLIRHAGGGELLLEATEIRGRRGLRVESLDQGPGFADFELATSDGYSSTGGLGTGLGTVNRLMDELEYHSLPTGGSRIMCCRWLRTEPRIPQCHLEIGVASRAHRQLPQNGDAFIIRQRANQALAGVIDGLGHGQFAQRAAQTARQYIDQHCDLPLEAIFRGVGHACQSTRGVVMALVLFDQDRQTFTAASIGNIELRVHGSAGRISFIVQRGVVGVLGHRAPLPRAEEHPWTPGMMLIMHSDGLHSHWDWSDFPGLWTQHSFLIAQRLVSTLSRPDDDATVLVVRNVRP